MEKTKQRKMEKTGVILRGTVTKVKTSVNLPLTNEQQEELGNEKKETKEQVRGCTSLPLTNPELEVEEQASDKKKRTRAKKVMPTVKVCASCQVEKPLTKEHFYPAGLSWFKFCKLCQSKINREKYIERNNLGNNEENGEKTERKRKPRVNKWDLLDPVVKEKILRLYNRGQTATEIANELQIPCRTMFYLIAKFVKPKSGGSGASDASTSEEE